jgi:hypothetical protein
MFFVGGSLLLIHNIPQLFPTVNGYAGITESGSGTFRRFDGAIFVAFWGMGETGVCLPNRKTLN